MYHRLLVNYLHTQSRTVYHDAKYCHVHRVRLIATLAYKKLLASIDGIRSLALEVVCCVEVWSLLLINTPINTLVLKFWSLWGNENLIYLHFN